MSGTRAAVVVAGLAWASVAGAATIDLTDRAALNTGSTTARIGDFTITAAGAVGYLQWTGWGVGHTGSVSRDEVDFPDYLLIEFDAPVDVSAARVGRLEAGTPYVDRPQYLPRPEVAGFSSTAWDGSTTFPRFVGGTASAWADVVLGFGNVRYLAFWGIGRQPGIWGDVVDAGTLAALTYTRRLSPWPPDLVPDPRVDPDPDPDPDVPPGVPVVPVPGPAPVGLVALGFAALGWRRRRQGV